MDDTLRQILEERDLLRAQLNAALDMLEQCRKDAEKKEPNGR